MSSIKKLRYIDWKQKKMAIPLLIVLMLVAARAMLPAYALKKTNKILSEFSPVISFHVADMDISLIKGAYRFENVTGIIKDNKETFVKVNFIDVSVAWRELFKGKIVTDIVVDQMQFDLIKNYKKVLAEQNATKKVKDKVFPLKIERLDVKNSSVRLEAFRSITNGKALAITDIDGRVTNLTPSEHVPISFLNLNANIIDQDSDFKIVGKINQKAKPIAWDIDMEVKEFNLQELNPYLKRHVPLTFTKGSADVYSELNSMEGKIKGYVKPFLKDLDIVKSREDFLGVKHLGIELITALANIILDEEKTDTVATILNFQYDKKLTLDTKEGAKKAIEHGFKQQISPGIEERYDIK